MLLPCAFESDSLQSYVLMFTSVLDAVTTLPTLDQVSTVTTTASTSTTTAAPAPEQEMFLCSFAGAANRTIKDDGSMCPFDDFAYCRTVRNNSCTYFRSGNVQSYNLVTFHVAPDHTLRFSVQLFADSRCTDAVLGIYVGARDMVESECRGLAIEGVGPVQV